MAGRQLAAVVLSEAERAKLLAWEGRRNTAQGLAVRARIILGCADGQQNKDVAANLGVHPMTVGKWRRRFQTQRLDGLRDDPRSGGTRSIDDPRIEAVITQTLEHHPTDATQWS